MSEINICPTPADVLHPLLGLRRNERDDRNEGTLRLEIAEREEKAERQFQIAHTVARNGGDASGNTGASMAALIVIVPRLTELAK